MLMKYQKGTFILVPNKQMIRNQKPYVQVIYLWICDFVDDNGQCFPSRRLLSEICGCSVSTIDKGLKILCDLGVLSLKNRKKRNEKTTNLYQIHLVEKDEGVAQEVGHLAQEVGQGVAQEVGIELNPLLLTQPIILSEVSDEQFQMNDYLLQVKGDKQRSVQLIGLYWEKKKYVFPNKKAAQNAIKRDLRSAKNLLPYPDEDITAVMDWLDDHAKEQRFDWKLETVFKYIDSYRASKNK